MSTVGDLNPTLADVASRVDPNGKVETIVELLKQTNPILEDMTAVEGNLPTGHRTTIRTGLPSATWRKLNYGVASSKSRTAQVTDACGMLEAYAEIDKALADLNGNSAAFRLSEDRAFLESMNQEMAETLFYGNTDVYPERFMGLAPRYAASSATPTEIGYNVIKGGGSGDDNTSVWLVVWGPNTIHGIYPKGSMAGFKHTDLGEQTLSDGAGGQYQGYRTHYKWDLGLTVRDWRYVARVCNLDVSALATAGDTSDTSANLLKLMTVAANRIPNLGMGRPVWYAHQDVITALEIKLQNKSNVWLSSSELPNGMPVTRFRGIPIKRCDQLLLTEATVS